MACPVCGYEKVKPQDKYCPACGYHFWDVDISNSILLTDAGGVLNPINLHIVSNYGLTDIHSATLNMDGGPIVQLKPEGDGGGGIVLTPDGGGGIGAGRGVLTINVLRRIGVSEPGVIIPVHFNVVVTTMVTVNLDPAADEPINSVFPADVWNRRDVNTVDNTTIWDPGVKCLTSWKITVYPNAALVPLNSLDVNGNLPLTCLLDDGANDRISNDQKLWLLHNVSAGGNVLNISAQGPAGPVVNATAFTINIPPDPPPGVSFIIAIDLGNSATTVAIKQTGAGGGLDLPFGSDSMWSTMENLTFRKLDCGDDGSLNFTRIENDVTLPYPPARVGELDIMGLFTDPKKHLFQGYIGGNIPQDLREKLSLIIFEALRRGLGFYWKNGGFAITGAMEHVVVSVPTIWPPSLAAEIENATQRALNLLGIDAPISLMPEGMAPLAFITLNNGGPQYYMVYDFGSSTTDITVYETGNNNPIGWAGANLGGHDVDENIQQALKKAGIDGLDLYTVRRMKESYDPALPDSNLGDLLGVNSTIFDDIMRDNIMPWIRADIQTLINNVLETIENVTNNNIDCDRNWTVLVTGNASLLKFPGNDGNTITLKDIIKEILENLLRNTCDVVVVNLMEIPDGFTPKTITAAGMANYIAAFRNVGALAPAGFSAWTLLFSPSAPGVPPQIVVNKGDCLPKDFQAPVPGAFFLVIDDRANVVMPIADMTQYVKNIGTVAGPGCYTIDFQNGNFIINPCSGQSTGDSI